MFATRSPKLSESANFSIVSFSFEIADLTSPTADNSTCNRFSFSTKDNILGLFSASTDALIMLSKSRPEPIPADVINGISNLPSETKLFYQK